MNQPQGKDATGLTSRIWRLANFVCQEVVEAKAQKKIVQTNEVYVRPQFKRFEYGEEGSGEKQWTDEFFEKSEWRWKHQREFIETRIKNAPIFTESIEALRREFGSKTGRDDFGLNEFVQKVSSRALEEINDEVLVDLVSRLINDLNNGPTIIRVLAWVEGIWLKQETISLGSTGIRRPKVEDLQQERPLSMAINPAMDLGGHTLQAPAIVEFAIRAVSGIAAQNEIAQLMGILRLFRLGSVREIKYSVTPESILRPAFETGARQNTHAVYRYGISGEDAQPLAEFAARMKPLLITDYHDGEPQLQPADLAFQRYSDAVLGGGRFESRITLAITCLEALYLKGEERSELSHKLSLRIASLLRLLEFNPLEVQMQVHRAYDIRSTHIHGGQVEKERLKDGKELCEKVLEYARLSVVTLLQLKGKVEKDEFINKLDRALLEPKSLERVKKHLGELIIPK